MLTTRRPVRHSRRTRIVAHGALVVALSAATTHRAATQQADSAVQQCQLAESMPDRIRACRIVVSADSTNVRAVYNLGVALSMERQFAPAESAWARYTALDPKQFAGYYNLGLTREYRREYPGALTAFRSALRYASHPAQEQTSCFHMGVVQYNLGQAAEALQWIRSAIAMDTSDLAAWSAAAIIAETQKRDSDAVSYWTRVGKANPDFLDKISPQEKADYEASLRRVGKQHPAFIAPRSSCRDTPSN